MSAPAPSRRAAPARAAGARAPARRRRGAAHRARRARERSTATARAVANVSASRRSSSVKRAPPRCLSCDVEDADGPVARDERDVEARACGETPRHVLVDLGVVDHRVDALAPAPLEHAAALRLGTRHRHADEIVGAFAGRGREAQLVLARSGARLRRVGRRAARAACAATRSSSRSSVGLGRERVADLVQRLAAGATSASPPRTGARSRSPPLPARASSVTSSWSSSVKSSPPAFSVRYRFPYATPRSRIGTPRNVRIGGWPAGSRPSADPATRSCRRSGCASWISDAEDSAPARERRRSPRASLRRCRA